MGTASSVQKDYVETEIEEYDGKIFLINFFKNLHRVGNIETQQKILRKYLDKNKDKVDVKDFYQSTPLMYAIKMNRLDLVKILVEYGANINAKNRKGYNPLLQSMIISGTIQDGFECTRYLLKNGADVKAVHLSIHNTLTLAATSSKTHDMTDIIKDLIAAGVDLNHKTNDRFAALHILLSSPCKRSENAINLLISAGADPNIQDAKGFTPLMYALAWTVENNLFRTLINAGADPNMRRYNGLTALIPDENTYGKQSKEILEKNTKFLLSVGADPNLLDSAGRNPLMITIQKMEEYGVKVTGLIEILINAGTDLDVRDVLGKTALLLVAESRSYPDLRKKIMSKLIHAGADYTIKYGDDSIFHLCADAIYLAECIKNKAITDTTKKIFLQQLSKNIKTNNTELRLAYSKYGQKIVTYNLMLQAYADEEEVYDKIRDNDPEILDYLTIRGPAELTKLADYINHV